VKEGVPIASRERRDSQHSLRYTQSEHYVRLQSLFGRHDRQRIQQYGASTLCSDVGRVMELFRVLVAAFPKIVQDCCSERHIGVAAACCIGQPARHFETMVSCDNALRRCTSRVLAQVFSRRVLLERFSIYRDCVVSAILLPPLSAISRSCFAIR
jgi:hypothetical protein